MICVGDYNHDYNALVIRHLKRTLKNTFLVVFSHEIDFAETNRGRKVIRKCLSLLSGFIKKVLTDFAVVSYTRQKC